MAPSQINQPATDVNSIISSIIYSAVLPKVEATAVVAFPPLGWPGVNFLFKQAMNYIAGLVFEQLSGVGVKLVITLQTDAEKSNYAAAEGKLRAAMLTKDPIKIKVATDEFKTAFRALVGFDGVAQ